MAERQTPQPLRRPPAVKPAEESQATVDETADEESQDGESEEEPEAESEGEDSAEDVEEAESETIEEADEEKPPAPAPRPTQKLNPPVEGQIIAIRPAEEGEPQPEAEKLTDYVLDSPQNFGIHIGGALHSFKKGKTRLTQKQKDACLGHSYVRDNGAQVYKIVRAAVPKPKA